MKEMLMCGLYKKVRQWISLVCCLCLCLSVCVFVQNEAAAKTTEVQFVEKQYFPDAENKDLYFTYFISQERCLEDHHAMFITGVSENFGKVLTVPERVDGVEIKDLFLCQVDAVDEVILPDVTENILYLCSEKLMNEDGYAPDKVNLIKKITVGRNFLPECLFDGGHEISFNDDASKYFFGSVEIDVGGYAEVPFVNLEQVIAPENAWFISVANSSEIYTQDYKKLLGVLEKPKQEMTEFTTPENCTEIGRDVFYNASNLSKVVLGDNVEKIGDYAFENCEKLATVEFDEKLRVIGDGAFSSTGLEEVEILSDSKIKFGGYVFSNCKKLKKVRINSKISKINKRMFSSCEALENFLIPKTVKKIGDSAFDKCKSLKKITLPQSVKQVGYDAFTSCKKLKKVIVLGKKTRLANYCIGYKWTCCDIFPMKNKPTIIAVKGSPAQKYAKKFKLKFKSIESWRKSVH